MIPAATPRFGLSRLLEAGALAAFLACPSCDRGTAAIPSDLGAATFSFSGSDASRVPRFGLLEDSTYRRLARACVAGETVRALERLGVADLRTHLDSLAAARVIRLDGARCEPGFPVFLGARRRALSREADAAAARLAPVVDSLAARVDSLAGGRRDIAFHLLWSRVMDDAWDTAWRRAFPRDSIPAVRWLALPERRFSVGTNYDQTVGDGSRAVTWAPRFMDHLGPLADHEYELTLLAWRRPVPDDSARAMLARFGVLDSLAGVRLFSYPRGGPLDSALDALAREYGDRAATAADWAEEGRRLATDPRDLFIILLHEVAYSSFERLADSGRLDVPRALAAGSPRTDAASLVSLVTGRPPRPADAAVAAYTRNGWHGSAEVVRRLRLALASDPRDVQTRWMLALSLYDIGRYAEAGAEFRRVTEAARRDTTFGTLVDWSRLWVGHCYDAVGQRSRALAIYRDVARAGDPAAQMMMGQYGIGPITAAAWAAQRLKAPFQPLK